MIRIRATVGVLLFLLLFCGLTGCGARDGVSAVALVSEMLSFEGDCPHGVLYDSSVEEGTHGYFSESLCAALYGDGKMPTEWEYVEEFAVFLSTSERPLELTVFVAVSHDGAERLAALCARRLAVLRRYYRGTDFEPYTASARIVMLGRYVVMAVSADAEGAIDVVRRGLR